MIASWFVCWSTFGNCVVAPAARQGRAQANEGPAPAD